MTAPQTRHLTILLTDIKGFTDKTNKKSRADIQRLLDEHRETVLPVLQGRGGRLVKSIGDAFLMTFESPTDAVLAGVGAQEALARRNAGRPEEDFIEIRVAINAGEVNLVEGDVFGEPVNITARIEGVAEAGEVYFTEAVYLAMNKSEVPSSEVGLLQLKGIPEKVRVYKVRRETPVGTGQVPPKAPPRAAVSAFAPGEKARLIPTEPPASAAPAEIKPAPAWRRAFALLLDFVICVTLLAALTGGNAGLKDDLIPHLNKDSAADIAIDDKGIKITGDDGSKISMDQAGLRIEPGADSRTPRRRKKLVPLAWLVYNFVFVWLMAATPGKKAFQLQVIMEDGRPPDWKRSAIRASMSLVSAMLALMLGYAWGLWSKRGQTWHDSAAGTLVISTRNMLC